MQEETIRKIKNSIRLFWIQLKFELLEYFQAKKFIKKTLYGVIPAFIIGFLTINVYVVNSINLEPTLETKAYIDAIFIILLYWLGTFHPILCSLLKFSKIISGPYEDGSYLFLFSQNSRFQPKYYLGRYISFSVILAIQIFMNYFLFFIFVIAIYDPIFEVLRIVLLISSMLLACSILFCIIFLSICTLLNYFIESKKVLIVGCIILFFTFLSPLQFKNLQISSGNPFDGTYSVQYPYYDIILFFDPMQLLYHYFYVSLVNNTIIPDLGGLSSDSFSQVNTYAMQPISSYLIKMSLVLSVYLVGIPLIILLMIFLKKTIILEEKLR